MKKILVAGAGGFIGGYLTKELISLGHQVTAVDVKPQSDWYQVQPTATNFTRDLSILEECEKSVVGIDEVYNLAAQSHVKVSFEMPPSTSRCALERSAFNLLRISSTFSIISGMNT